MNFDTEQDDAPEMSAVEMLVKIVPIIVLVTLVLGGIYGGIFTPTESGAAGALGAIVIGAALFALMMLLVLTLVYFFPVLATALVN